MYYFNNKKINYIENYNYKFSSNSIVKTKRSAIVSEYEKKKRLIERGCSFMDMFSLYLQSITTSEYAIDRPADQIQLKNNLGCIKSYL